ncbi:hypothetical protein PoB_004253600 [Plakobranchus ocellatus]|uniref:Uncharacterized protein n=1 Tax=Plakobranchus ocellatus TaxID=259542 RepID=A0AAV4AY48_9GAST|nr:hypothetical protein PoB_004253600 [Plakobranchus ocellatus]
MFTSLLSFLRMWTTCKAALNRALFLGKFICWSDLKPEVNAYIHAVWQENWDAKGANKLHEVLVNSAKEVKKQVENGRRYL